MKTRTIHTALLQMPVVKNLQTNLHTAAEMVTKAAQSGAELVVLPEMFCCQYQSDAFIEHRQPAGSGVWTALRDMAAVNGVYLVGGSMPEDDLCGHIYNTCFCFDPDGRQIGAYRKAHLFDIDVEGGQRFMESDVFTPGCEALLMDTPLGKIGVMICFDIRFPEWARRLTLAGAQVIVVPAAFNMTTGPAHWEMTFRARALDNQLYMLGCAPARDETGSYVSYGHSIVTGPWGDVQQQLDEKPGILFQSLELEKNAQIRKQLPLLSGRRMELY